MGSNLVEAPGKIRIYDVKMAGTNWKPELPSKEKLEILLEEYSAKVKEKQELIEKEKLLDEQLKTIISEFNEVFKDKGLGDKGVRK